MENVKVTLFYRDGNNYKFHPSFELNLPDEKIEHLKSIECTDADVEYDNYLGIEQDEFHAAINFPYDEISDHNLVEIINVQKL